MFMRCCVCGGSAHPALKHLHGTCAELCYDCSQRLLQAQKRSHSQAAAKAEGKGTDRRRLPAEQAASDLNATLRAMAKMAELWHFAA